jgi:DNA invertase Pin-like site-specific DNA recombinase
MALESKKAYLYSRVSNTIQSADGHGIERQIEAARKFLEAYPEYEVDDSTVISDHGISAYSGANITDSAGLGGFLTAVREGTIPRGSLLVIEAPDRLTRLGIRKGQRLFDELAEHGIDVGLVRFGVIVKHDTDNDFTSSLIVSIGLYLGHLESKQKSERICATMAKRRREMRTGGIKATPHCPMWLTPKSDNSGFDLNSFAEVVQLMFKYRLSGLGSHKIADRLQEEGYTDHKGNAITFQRVTHCLRRKSVMGQYQPHTITKVNGKRKNIPEGEPIMDFYPRIVSDSDFYEVQKLLDTTKGGRREEFTNFLRDIVVCHTEGCNEKFVYTATKDKGVTYDYLKCHSSTTKHMPSCGAKSVPFRKIKEFILPALQKLDYVTLFSGAVMESSEVGNIRKEIERLRETIATNREALNYVSGSARVAVENVIEEELNQLHELRKKAESSSNIISQTVMEDYQTHIRNNTLDTPEKRIEFNNRVKQLVKEIKVHRDHWEVTFRGVELTVGIAYGKSVDVGEVLTNFYKHRERLIQFDEVTPEEITQLTGLKTKITNG